MAISITVVETLCKGKVRTVEPNQQVETDAGAAPAATSDHELVTETLVEEVSIDGMCGVY